MVKGNKDNLIDKFIEELKSNDFKIISINKESYEIEARYFKLAINEGGRGRIKTIFNNTSEGNTKITIKITVSTDTATLMETNYANVYNALRLCFKDELILDTEEYQGIFKDIKDNRNSKIEDVMSGNISELINTDEKRAQKEEKERVEYESFKKKAAEIENNIVEGIDSILSKYSKDEINIFTNNFYEQLCIAGSNLGYSKLKMSSYITDKELKRVKNEYAKELEDNETILLFYSLTNKEGFLLTHENLYFCMKDTEGDSLHRGRIESKKIQKIDIKEGETKAIIKVNDVELFFINKSTCKDDYLSIKGYIDRLISGDFTITDEQISNLIENKVEKKLLTRIKGFLYEGESILYIAWGLDSLTAKDYIVCTSNQLLIINREVFGLGEHIKQFEYKDIVSISTAKSRDGDLLSSLMSTAFKQSNLEIYAAGTSFRIETLLRIEAERVIKIVNNKKRNANKQTDIIIHERIVKEKPKEDLIDQIEKLAKLKDIGVLSEDEFQLKKTELLMRL
ncbi:MAG TPA: SHOCT domain-containing protein [Clostridiales bacterium]|nr:SHOCT domain-containing protein [Clostridiales bacterium]